MQKMEAPAGFALRVLFFACRGKCGSGFHGDASAFCFGLISTFRR